MARPAAFDRDRVLGQAMQTFWDRGYGATSISQLVEATGLKPGSLYAAFDSKEGLFLAALDRYAAESRRRLKEALHAGVDPLTGIEHFLRRLVQSQYATQPPRGCLLVNSALELGRHNPTVQRRVRQHLEGIEAELRQALQAARDDGQLGADQSPAALARLLMTMIWGLRVLGGTGADASQAEQVVDQIAMILRQG
jgi:TetR/AcrR family transcriptional repressor of nem operon